jgi:aspartyl-tRNA synthetase
LDAALNPRQIEAMRVRTIVNRHLHTFYLERGFLPVQSPAIVGDWAESRTGAFPVDFYGERAFLTLSRMIHHQIIQSLGYGRIYEIGQIFRTSDATSRKKLAEFTNVIIGVTRGGAVDLIDQFTQMIESLYAVIQNADLTHLAFPKTISFETITYRDLLAKAGVDAITGHQLPKKVRRYLNDTYPSFVWVTGFPEHTRPFFVRSIDGVCDDAQLWFKGRNFLAAGGARESDLDIILRKIRNEGKEPERYEFYLNALRMGLPPVANIDLGIERFLANFFDDCTPADFTFFPRYEGLLTP